MDGYGIGWVTSAVGTLSIVYTKLVPEDERLRQGHPGKRWQNDLDANILVQESVRSGSDIEYLPKRIWGTFAREQPSRTHAFGTSDRNITIARLIF